MSDNLRRALFGNSRRKPTAAEVVIGAVLDHQANQQNRRQALLADPILPVELQGIIKRSDYQIRNRGHHTECWIWDKSSFVLKDPTSHRHRDVNEVVYRAFAGRDVPSSSAILTRCGQAKCIKYEHFTIIPRREGNIIYRIRNRREAKINKPQRNIIAKASKKYNLTEKEQVQIFHVSESQLRETNEDALKPTITGRPTESAAPILTTVEIETTPEGTATIPEPEMPYAEPEIIELDIPPEPDKPLSPEPETRPEPQTPPEPKTPSNLSVPATKKSKVTAAVLAFTLGGFGAHKFYLGHRGAGIVHLLLSATVIGALVNVPICVVEFFIYLSKSEEDFHQTYVVNRRRFF